MYICIHPKLQKTWKTACSYPPEMGEPWWICWELFYSLGGWPWILSCSYFPMVTIWNQPPATSQPLPPGDALHVKRCFCSSYWHPLTIECHSKGYSWLVVWNIWMVFPYIGKNHPNWLLFFRGFQWGEHHQPDRQNKVYTL